MNKFSRASVSAGLAVVLSTWAAQASAVGRLADVNVYDRDSGERLKVHYHQGQYWVVGRPGAHYAVRINSQTNGRLLAVTSVDGINVITGDNAGFDQRGYVFDPYVSYDIDGWRKSNREIAAFTFTSLGKSYAARTGRPGNVGVIGVALFKERPVHVYEPYPVAPAPIAKAEVAEQAAATASADASAASGTSARAGSRQESEMDRPRASAPKLGTGHGRRETSWVSSVAFERESERPAEIIRIRYDSRDNLVAMGVIRKPVPRVPQAFPEERYGYVPDP